MGERKSNSQSPKPKMSKMAIASVLPGILGISIAVLRLGFYRPWWSEFVARNVAGSLGIAGLVLGFATLRRISKRIAVITLSVMLCFFLLQLPPFVIVFFTRSSVSPLVQRCLLFLGVASVVGLLAIPASREWRSSSRANVRGGALAPLGMALGVLLLGLWWAETCGPVSLAMRMGCADNLRQLGKAMVIYARDNGGRYPEADRWCDLLLHRGQAGADSFLCPRVKWEWRRQVFPWPVPENERCYYAMNPSCEPNAPSDMVLLFETKGEWNKFGGPEVLTVHNHQGDGCSVLFNDGRAEFVNLKHIAELKWGVEERDGKSVE